jgi:hypothetical protein
MKIKNDGDYPQPIYDALIHSDYDRGESDYSITQLIDSPRPRRLKEIFKNQVSYSASEFAPSVMGSAGHSLIERFAKPPFVAEERVFYPYRLSNGESLIISGAIDLQKIDKDGVREISDLKFCKSYAVINGPKREWELQLNGYAWLLRRNGHRVTKLQVIAYITDWNKRKALSEIDYPAHQLTIVDVPLWDYKAQDNYFVERLTLHSESELSPPDELPLCSDEERWAKPTSYAVMKNKNIRALRVFSNYATAKAYIEEHLSGDTKNKYRIKERPGEYVRCASWCKVSKFCNQNRSN